MFGRFDDPKALLGKSNKAAVTNLEGSKGINHQFAALLKIKQSQQTFTDRRDCCLSLAQFLEVFQHADFHCNQAAADFFRMPFNLM